MSSRPCPLTAPSCLRHSYCAQYTIFIHTNIFIHNPWHIFLKGYTILERGKRINKKTEVFIHLETSFSYVALAFLELTAVFLPECRHAPCWDFRCNVFENCMEYWKEERNCRKPLGCAGSTATDKALNFLELQMAVTLVLGLKPRSSRRAAHWAISLEPRSYISNNFNSLKMMCYA